MKGTLANSLVLGALTILVSGSASALNITCWDKASPYGDLVRISGYLNIDPTQPNPSGAPGYYYRVHGGSLVLSMPQAKQNLTVGDGTYSLVRAVQSGEEYITSLSIRATGLTGGGHYVLVSKTVQPVGGSGSATQYQAVLLAQNGGSIKMACDTSGNSSPPNPHPNH